jgi:glucose dehydrogenase
MLEVRCAAMCWRPYREPDLERKPAMKALAVAIVIAFLASVTVASFTTVADAASIAAEKAEKAKVKALGNKDPAPPKPQPVKPPPPKK